MTRLANLAILGAALALGACSVGDTERQWYKPNGEYTTADFERDRRACTHNRQLDEGCLRQRGWTSLSSQQAPPPKPAASPTPRRY